MPKPAPLAPPVMNATFPSTSFIAYLLQVEIDKPKFPYAAG